MLRLSLVALGLSALLACSEAKDPVDDTGVSDTDTDTDTDSDTDTDTDTDSDADTDTDTDVDADIVINELLASNDTILEDENGDFDDWLELYNPGSSALDLSDWGIGDGGDPATAYRLPEGTEIAAGGYLLIWCDDDGVELHADFKLSASGETLTLWDDGDQVIDEVTFGAQDTDVSYGRDGDGASSFTTFESPTPGAAN